ncbi:MAG: FtsX-like permease family protein [Fimbriimonadaceae bacterium]|nr:FtsX-like permease family protein [Chthonomonadaceae bacterium]MCO5298187.1 FtsX-like permease family protein [Fimbriimonadaceae bacterium]
MLLISGIVSMIDSIPLSIRTIYRYSEHSLGVTPRGDPSLTESIRQEILAESPVPIERIVVCRAAGSQVQSIVGKWPFVVLGLKPDDLKFMLKELGSTRVEGRLPEVGAPEVVISEPVARNLSLKIGSTLLGPNLPESYSPYDVKVVGIAQTDLWLMFADYDYEAANHFPPLDNLMVIAPTLAQQEQLDRWAVARFKGRRAQIFAFHRLEEETNEMFRILYRILDVVIGTLVAVITLMMGMLINIYQSQRIVEFGLLQALGYTKRQLLRRTMVETIAVLVAGWLIGIAAAYGLLNVAKAVLMDPQAFALDPLDPAAYRYTLPVPFAILAVAALTVWLRFRKFDPVGVVERRLV